MAIKTKSFLSFLCIIPLVFFHSTTYGHGFAPNTMIQLSDGSAQTIKNVCLRALHNDVAVSSYDTNTLSFINQYITTGRQSKSNCSIQLGFDSFYDSNNDIVCTPTQEFFVVKIQALDSCLPA